jgi:Variant SH3 domain
MMLYSLCRISNRYHGSPIYFTVQALFDYEAEDDEELTFSTGDLIAVVDTGDGDWWVGELWDTETNSCVASGTVPSNYVEEVDVA